MTYHRYPHPEQILIQADKWSYVTNAKRSRISAVEVAHLAHGIVAKMDSPIVFIDPNLYRVKELYSLLMNVAQNGKINNVIFENGYCEAPLLDWCMFLCAIDYPIPDLFLSAADEMLTERETQSNSNDEISKYTTTSQNQFPEGSINDSIATSTKSNSEKLEVEIVRVSKKFSKIPRKYYRFHPDIVFLISSSMTAKAFEDLVTTISKKCNLPKRKQSCPKKDFLDAYEAAYPELVEWFQKIREDRKKASKIKS